MTAPTDTTRATDPNWRGGDAELASTDELVLWFERCRRVGNHLIGTEQEKFGVVRNAEGMPEPVRYREHILPTLEAMMERFNWKPAKDRGVNGELIALERDGASITLEPGGQFELSGKPLPTVHHTCAEFSQHYEELDAIAKPMGISWLACGFHPFATREEIDWMPKGRYEVMRAYLPTRGDMAVDMMLRTCTVQANFDYADEAQCGRRLRLMLGLSSLITALFANSPYQEGKFTGYRSLRSRVWEHVDPDRCGILPFVFEGEFSWQKYVDWALDVPMFFVKRGHDYHPHHPSFRRYMSEGFTTPDGVHQRATQGDWELHLSTLFPEVRLKPFIEIRGADSVGSKTVCALPALCKGLMYDEEAGRAAWDLVARLDIDKRMDLWGRARINGLSDPEVRAKCQQLLSFARLGLGRLDVRDGKGRSEARFLDTLDLQVTRAATPAGEALTELGEEPGRSAEGRAKLANYFRFAGAEL